MDVSGAEYWAWIQGRERPGAAFARAVPLVTASTAPTPQRLRRVSRLLPTLWSSRPALLGVSPLAASGPVRCPDVRQTLGYRLCDVDRKEGTQARPHGPFRSGGRRRVAVTGGQVNGLWIPALRRRSTLRVAPETLDRQAPHGVGAPTSRGPGRSRGPARGRVRPPPRFRDGGPIVCLNSECARRDSNP